MEKTNLIVWLCGLVILGLVVNVWALLALTHPQVQQVPQVVNVPTPVLVQTPYNDTQIQNKLNDISSQVSKDDNWKADAQSIATAEWTRNGYRELFNFLDTNNVSIDDKTDISSVIVKDEQVSSFNVDEQDASVTQTLKVYFENSDGTKVKKIIYVDTKVHNDDIDSQDFSF